ncbi:ferrous iron transporter B [Basfia succiniciproducens]|uniref:Ferrous iron transport protein B n=1 Tax=Basfia succiniciproducens TaxID=653940 RepID=A0A1G5ADA3_9PAST|nr:ferrous iron transporter B [Basfia succiniciproducens]QIM68520.1 ferrous iron transporter B [Basfia succiniciproducens]SCX75858.1 ferrous iron transport protein B [Basfia succiniciproducens]
MNKDKLTCFALVGAPNCGKTVLFNGLTGSNAKVANYPGVTVERREGLFVDDPSVSIIDLPGTYSLRTTTLDEAVARDEILGKYGRKIDGIIAVADATNLRMTLRMVLELKMLGLPMVVSLNLIDVARSRGLTIDEKKLSELLGVPVLETVATRKEGIRGVKNAIANLPQNSAGIDSNQAAQLLESLDSNALYAQVEDILAQTVKTEMVMPKWHQRLDRLTLHPVWGFVLLLLVLLLVFQAVYSWSEPVMDFIEDFFANLGEWVATLMPEGILQDLILNGIIAGVGSVLVFVPQITILFAFILLLEDSGYLPRAAFLLDNLLSTSGLSGRAFIPLLSSFACAVPSVMSARTIQDPRERLVTIAIAPILTCSARLPVYALIIGAVIPDQTVWGIFNLQGLVLFGLYFIGVFSAGLVAYIMKRLARRKGSIRQFPLLMELPTFRLPNFRHIFSSLWDKVKAFLKRAGTVIFALSVILWALVTFPGAPEGAAGAAIDYSFAGMLGSLIQPIFAPLGFTWQMCIAMIPGIAAREVVVAALGTVYAVGASGSEEAIQNALVPIVHEQWGIPTALAFLAWYVYAPMCMATLAVIKREVNSMKKTLMIAGYLFVLAYIFSFVVYQISIRIF